ncbi:hypothetical protein EXN66_Car018841 [Channa argus]|uniref:Uncharacterized protein n=1 Tax=Channa argus TaxID=215402 RepID=A0A6G1QLG7_CHAAH|nr:hypothetical protein EXN66_Car018841 [Channa argus]
MLQFLLHSKLLFLQSAAVFLLFLFNLLWHRILLVQPELLVLVTKPLVSKNPLFLTDILPRELWGNTEKQINGLH